MLPKLYENDLRVRGIIQAIIDGDNEYVLDHKYILWGAVQRDIEAIIKEKDAEIARLTAYCDKLAAGYPDGMLPTDIQVIKDANWTFAQQLHEAQAEIERLRAVIAEYWRTGNAEKLQETGCDIARAATGREAANE